MIISFSYLAHLNVSDHKQILILNKYDCSKYKRRSKPAVLFVKNLVLKLIEMLWHDLKQAGDAWKLSTMAELQ